MRTAVLHARVVICKLSSLYVTSVCSHPEKNPSINSQIKGEFFWTAGLWQRRKSFFMHHFEAHSPPSASLLPGDGKLLLSAFHSSLLNQPWAHDDGGGWRWITGAESMRQKKITVPSKQDSSKLTAIWEQNIYFLPSLMTPQWWRDSFYGCHDLVRGTFSQHLCTVAFTSLELNPELSWYDDYSTMLDISFAVVYKKCPQKWGDRESLSTASLY